METSKISGGSSRLNALAIGLGCLGLLFAGAGVISLLLFAAAGSAGSGGLLAGLGGNNDHTGGFSGDRPTGLFFMTRYWVATGSLEKAVWYFDENGSVYQNLSTGFSEADLAAHEGQRGTYSVDGDQMTVQWADGNTTTSTLERDGDGFAWDTGMFVPVEPFDGSEDLGGTWEGGSSLTTSAGYAAVARTLLLREDGTYQWDSASSFSGASAQSGYSTGGEKSSSGRWTIEGFSMTLESPDGETVRGIAFPFDDEDTPVNPDQFFFAGTMYRRFEPNR